MSNRRAVFFALMFLGLAAWPQSDSAQVIDTETQSRPAMRPPVPATPPSTRPSTGTGLILGRVIDMGTGQPVPGAIVTIGATAMVRGETSFGEGATITTSTPGSIDGRPGASTLRVQTDSEGRFVFQDLPAGAFAFSVTTAGYVGGGYGQQRPAGAFQPLELADGQKIGGITLPLWKYAAIGGTVTDEAGEPVVGMTVRVLKAAMVAGKRQLTPDTQTGLTDDRGIYRIGLLVPGDYLIAIPITQTSMPVGADDAEAFASEIGSAPLMQEGDWLRGVANNAVPPVPDAANRTLTYETVFHPAARSSTDAALVTLASGDERTGIDMRLRLVPGVRVTGMVIGPEGPVANQSLHLAAAGLDALQSETDFDTAVTTTDSRGAFTFFGVTPGTYVLRAVSAPQINSTGPRDAILFANLPVTVSEAGAPDLQVVLQEGAGISGRIQLEGTSAHPAADVWRSIAVTVEQADGRTTGPMTFRGVGGRFDANGQVATDGVPAGRYLVRVVGAPSGWTFKAAMYNGKDVSSTPLDVDGADIEGVIFIFSDRTTEISGSVQNANGADADATVLVFPADDQAWTEDGAHPRRMKTARVTRAGRYTFTELPDGDYFVVAIRDELAGGWPDPKFLESLRASATRVSIRDGDKKMLDLRTVK